MDTRTPSRTGIISAGALMIAAATIGATAIPQPHWISALQGLARTGGTLAMIAQLDGARSPPRTRWALAGAAILLAGAIGLIARMVVHGLLVRGG